MKNIYELYKELNAINIVNVRYFACGCVITQTDEYTMYLNDWQDDYESFDAYLYDMFKNVQEGFYSEINIENNCLILTTKSVNVCPKCRVDDKCFIDTLDKPAGFENVTLMHGLNAYYSDGSYQFILESFDGLMAHPEWQICCSTEAIGDIGVLIKGDVLAASYLDLNTEIMKSGKNKGRRYYVENSRKEKANHLVESYEELIDKRKDIDHMNDEIITMNNQIVGIWKVKDAYMSNAGFEALEILKIYYPNMPIVEVKATDYV